MSAASPSGVLAVDIGGTKILAALVEAGRVADRLQVPTDRAAQPDAWISAIAERTSDWHSRIAAAGVAATGLVEDGRWTALNPGTLNVPASYPLAERLGAAIGRPVLAVNDAQAAAWGEYRYGAGRGGDMVFLTISTGVGGGVVVNGGLLTGLAGHFGLFQDAGATGDGLLEDEMSGRWIAAQTAEGDARLVFRRAGEGDSRCRAVVRESARRAARLCRNIQLAIDPARIVIGGGVGLAENYLDLVRQELSSCPPRLRPQIHAAELGALAGVTGAADLAAHQLLGNA